MAKTAKSNPLVDSAAADLAETKRKAKASSKPRAARWTDEEVKRLRAFVPDGVPSGSWPFIASHFEGRTAQSCREKYYKIADQKKKGQIWSIEEDELLADLQGREGNKWKLISESIEGRSEHDVKNRWYSLQRSEIKRAKRAEEFGSNAKATARKKPARSKDPERKMTKSSSFDVMDALNASHVFDMPPLPDAGPFDPSSMIDIMDAGAVSSLVAMKTGLTPVRRATTSHPLADEAEFFGVTDWNKENIAPTTVDASSSHMKLSMGPTPTRKFIYPPPPAYKQSAEGIISEVVQSEFVQFESKISPPAIVPNSLRNIKAHEIFSPSYGLTSQATTPSSGIPLDSLPLCDSIPLKRTPMIADQSHHFIGQCSTIMHSPLVSKKKSTPNAFTPLPFDKTPATADDPGLFFQTAGMLQSSSSKHIMHYNLPLYSPMTKSTPSGATAV